MVNFLIWLIVGGVIGWLAGLVMGDRGGVVMNVVIGIVGAFVGGLIAGALGIGGSTINSGNFSLSSLIISFLGAVILLAIVNLIRRGSARV